MQSSLSGERSVFSFFPEGNWPECVHAPPQACVSSKYQESFQFVKMDQQLASCACQQERQPNAAANQSCLRECQCLFQLHNTDAKALKILGLRYIGPVFLGSNFFALGCKELISCGASFALICNCIGMQLAPILCRPKVSRNFSDQGASEKKA